MVDYNIATAVYIVILAAVPLYLALVGHSPKEGEEPPTPEDMSRWVVCSCLYCNPNDPRRLVPRSGDGSSGYTVNFRSKALAIEWFSFVCIGGAALFLLGVSIPIWGIRPT
jgi:uncharacterized membrane protein